LCAGLLWASVGCRNRLFSLLQGLLEFALCHAYPGQPYVALRALILLELVGPVEMRDGIRIVALFSRLLARLQFPRKFRVLSMASEDEVRTETNENSQEWPGEMFHWTKSSGIVGF
jgi:hypothetical protein